MLAMRGDVDGSIIDACGRLLRGETSVIDFTYAFRAAVAQITPTRALHGVEIELFDALEDWEASGWQDRPATVDRLRAIAASATA
jgi:hypothetical protein